MKTIIQPHGHHQSRPSVGDEALGFLLQLATFSRAFSSVLQTSIISVYQQLRELWRTYGQHLFVLFRSGCSGEKLGESPCPLVSPNSNVQQVAH
jgi:hypothetical protein